MISVETTSWITLVFLMVCWDWLLYHDHWTAECRYIFWWHMSFTNSLYIASHGAATNFFCWTSFFFFFRLFYFNSISLHFDPWIFCHLLAKLTTSFWLFLWMPVTMNKQFHVHHACQITTWGTIFTGKAMSVQGMSQVLVTHFLGNKFWNVP